MMDWTLAIEQEQAALMRVVALLCALAGLAELSVNRSPAVRGFVLWVLRRAEAAARDFVAGGEDTEIAPMPAGPAGARPADAMRLALSLRALARHLEHQIECQARLISAACGERGGGMKPSLLGAMPAMHDVTMSMLTALTWPLPHPAPDTS